MENNWAIERLIDIIREHENTIKNMANEICKLRGIVPNENEILKIKREFEIEKNGG